MARPSGTKLSPYEIQSPLGTGEVYRARDARLDRTVAIIFAFVATVAVCAPAKQPRGGEALPLWTADLSALSYALRPDPGYVGGQAHAGVKFDMGIFFPASGEVISYFLTRKEPAELAQRKEPKSSDPFQLQIIAFDAATGSVKYSKELPGRSGEASMMITDQGNFIVRSGDLLRLYASDFKILNERRLEVEEYDAWSLRLSPTGRTLLLRHDIPFDTHIEALRTSSFSTIGSAPDSALFNLFATSDDSLITTDYRERRILFRKFTGPWQVLWDGKTGRCVPVPVFLRNSELLNLCGHELTVMTTSGEITMRDRLENNKEHLEQLSAVTPDGRFFAVSAEQTKGGFMNFTSVKRNRTRILIYDTTLGKRITCIPVDPIPKKDYDFALSPDGRRLAVLTDGWVRLYVLPASSGCRP